MTYIETPLNIDRTRFRVSLRGEIIWAGTLAQCRAFCKRPIYRNRVLVILDPDGGVAQ